MILQPGLRKPLSELLMWIHLSLIYDIIISFYSGKQSVGFVFDFFFLFCVRTECLARMLK